ncbi:hypothetical protein ACX3O0_12585 [Homoserinimonas sp. A447]
MDEELNRNLREQEHRLRGVIAVFARASRRAATLGDTVGWVGPASAAYDAAIGALHIELWVAEVHLNGALRDTVSAITTEDSCG